MSGWGPLLDPLQCRPAPESAEPAERPRYRPGGKAPVYKEIMAAQRLPLGYGPERLLRRTPKSECPAAFCSVHALVP